MLFAGRSTAKQKRLNVTVHLMFELLSTQLLCTNFVTESHVILCIILCFLLFKSWNMHIYIFIKKLPLKSTHRTVVQLHFCSHTSMTLPVGGIIAFFFVSKSPQFLELNKDGRLVTSVLLVSQNTSNNRSSYQNREC